MKKVTVIYIVSAEMGDYAFDQDFSPLGDDEYDPLITMTFQQETLAPAEDWEDWALDRSTADMIKLLPEIIKSKLKRMIGEWDGPAH